MKLTFQLYDASSGVFASIRREMARIRRLQTLSGMIIGIIHSERVHLSVWAIYTHFKGSLRPVVPTAFSAVVIESPHQPPLGFIKPCLRGAVGEWESIGCI